MSFEGIQPTHLVSFVHAGYLIQQKLWRLQEAQGKLSLKSFMTLKPSCPTKPPAKSPESQESMISPLHSSPLLPPSPELPSRIWQLQVATNAIYMLKLPMHDKTRCQNNLWRSMLWALELTFTIAFRVMWITW